MRSCFFRSRRLDRPLAGACLGRTPALADDVGIASSANVRGPSAVVRPECAGIVSPNGDL
jgi:hypothetical protein